MFPLVFSPHAKLTIFSINLHAEHVISKGEVFTKGNKLISGNLHECVTYCLMSKNTKLKGNLEVQDWLLILILVYHGKTITALAGTGCASESFKYHFTLYKESVPQHSAKMRSLLSKTLLIFLPQKGNSRCLTSNSERLKSSQLPVFVCE